MRRYAGEAVVGTGIVHTVFGLLAYSGPLGAMLRGGFIDSVGTDPARDGAVWFLTTGLLLVMLGGLSRWTQGRVGTVPGALGWSLLGLALGIGVVMPVSGWPLVATAGGLLVAASRPHGTLGPKSEGRTRPDAGTGSDGAGRPGVAAH